MRKMLQQSLMIAYILVSISFLTGAFAFGLNSSLGRVARFIPSR
jgi:hypothetical protein